MQHPEEVDQQALEMSLLAAKMGEERKADAVRILELRQKSVVADYFVVMTGFNRRQIQSIAWEFDREMKQRGIKKLGVEGYDTGWWVLIDYGAVVVHIFHADARDYYELDMLWGDVPVLDWHAELARLGHEPLSAMSATQASSDLEEPEAGPTSNDYEPGTPPERGPGLEPEELKRLQAIAEIDAHAADDHEVDDNAAEERPEDDSPESNFDLGIHSWRGDGSDDSTD